MSNLTYDINDLIENSVPEALGTPDFTGENTPSFSNTSTDGIAPETIVSGEIQGNVSMTDGHLQSENFVTGSSGWRLTPDGNFEGNDGNFRGDVTGATGTFAGSLIGATIKTATSGTRFEMTSTSFQGINSTGTVVFENIISGADAGDVIMGDDASTSYAKWDNSAGTFTVYGIGKFGGTGANGALAVSSGTTQIDCGGAGTFEKNYTSISITGTGKVEFINPASTGTVITIKSQGNVTLTSSTAPMLSAVGMGSSGTGLVTVGVGATAGTDGAQTGPGGQAGGVCPTLRNDFNVQYLSKYFSFFAAGAKGGNGANGLQGGTGGTGGLGGGVMFLQCGGTFTFTTANGISVAGVDGTAGGAATSGSLLGATGGSGGGGGTCFILYQTAGTITGTVNASGGAGGAGGARYSGTGNVDQFGGAGSGGGASTSGNGGTTGITVGGAGAVNVAGIAGGNGFSILSINSEFL